MGVLLAHSVQALDRSTICSTQDLAPKVDNARPSVVVIGSATGSGFLLPDSTKSFAWRLGELIKERKPGECLVNLSSPGFSTRDTRSTALPVGWWGWAPDPERNIDQALSLGPALLIISLPSNDPYSRIPSDESLASLGDMLRRADSAGTRVLVMGAQPRGDIFASWQIDSLLKWKQYIDTVEGIEKLSIWDSIAQDPVTMFPWVDLAQSVYLNDSGHAIIYRSMIRTPAWQSFAPGNWDDAPLPEPRSENLIAPAPGNYLPGSILEFSALFTSSITVTGAPVLRLTIGSRRDSAVFAGGSGTDTLRFRYTVPHSARDSDGIVIGKWIDLNGGALVDSAGNPAALNLRGCDTLLGIALPGDKPPEVSTPIQDTTMEEDFPGSVEYSLSAHFRDPEESPLSYAISGDTDIVRSAIAGAMACFQSKPNAHGLSTQIVTATDGWGLSVSDTFRITVRSINDPPVVAAHLADTTLLEDFAPAVRIPLAAHFGDPDGNVSSFQIASGTAIVTTSLANDTLVIDAIPNAHGTGSIAIRAYDDSGAAVLDSFRITVRSINDPPVVASHLADLALEESFASPVFIPLVQHFADPDGGIASYQVSVDTALVRADLLHDTLRLLDKPLAHGTEKVRITAFDDSGASITDSFTVTLTPPGGSTEILSKPKTTPRISTSGPAFAVARTKTLSERLPATSTESPELGLSSQGACRNTTGCSSLPVQLRETGSLDVSIFDNLGTRVIAASVRVGPMELQRMQRDLDGAPSDRIEWNQRDTRGHVVPTGVYLWQIEFISDRGEAIRSVVKMGIRPNTGN